MAFLTLNNGMIFEGDFVGEAKTVSGEVVISDNMVGFQNAVTAPSNDGKIVVFTYPEVGNVGYNDVDFVSGKVTPAAVVVRNLCENPSNWKTLGTFTEFLKKHNLPCLVGADTRKLTRAVMETGPHAGTVSEHALSDAELRELKKLKPKKEHKDQSVRPKAGSRDKSIEKVLVIGSGPIVIGQAAEFDYAGTQACRALKEQGISVVLCNSNPATIMTDKTMADKVYLEPLTVEAIKNIIVKEKPDSLLATLGGQTGLNLGMELFESGFLTKYNVRLLGTNVDAIRKAEDRKLFKETMEKIGVPCIESVIVNEVEPAVEFAKKIGYPIIVRPAYTLGGTGGGIAHNEQELRKITEGGLRLSRVHQALIERCIAGWKEIEYEALRDHKGNAITVCSMENIDPVGVHTGDSIVVAPVQTLREEENEMLRTASLNIIKELGIEGGCNVQFALDPESSKYYIIEVNPRLSRSSALASKATGYPIARVATLIAIGYNLDEIRNKLTNGYTSAVLEPVIDYVVCKFPRWPFDKFQSVDRSLGTKMKATGEIMAIGANIESAILKAVRSLELGYYSLESRTFSHMSAEKLKEELKKQNDERFFCVAEALRKGVTIDEVHTVTKIDEFFLCKIKNIVELEEAVKKEKLTFLTAENLRKLKTLGFSDRALAGFAGVAEAKIKNLRKEHKISPVYNAVDTCAGRYAARATYLYSGYNSSLNETERSGRKTVAVIGSGPIRIGQGMEFDYCSVHCVLALQKAGYEAVIINNNPETVSTDFDTADKLYFEPMTAEDVIEILELEQPDGVIVQFGGQTAIKLARAVAEAGFKIIGTQQEYIDKAEDRKEFDELLTELNLCRPQGKTVFTGAEAVEAASKLGYPVLVRPSYVLGGQGMEIAYGDKDIISYMEIINRESQEHPILVDKYVLGKELEVDAISDGKDILIPGIMEHIERAGIHSGDSISVYPPINVSKQIEKKLIEITRQLALKLHTSGLINIQYILADDEIYIIEVNPRSSRTVPYISKVTGVPMVELAVRCSLGEPLKNMGYGTGLYKKSDVYAVKVPVFSSEKIPELEISLSPEMKSTGEVLGLSHNYREALLKGIIASGIRIPKQGGILVTVKNDDKKDIVPVIKGFSELGHKIYATAGTAEALRQSGVKAETVERLYVGDNDISALLHSGKVSLIINTPTKGRQPERDGFRIRRIAVEQGITCLTSLDTANALLMGLTIEKTDSELRVTSLQEVTDGGQLELDLGV